jgi:Domain of unknown function (DUF4280)
MGKLVCTGATLQCSFGAKPATFSASGQQVSATQAAGIVTDTSAHSIPAFGTCTSLSNPRVAAATSAAGNVLTPQPCQPVIPAPWTPGAAHVTIGRVAALDDASQCACAWAGKITVSSPGQEKASAQASAG